MVGEDKSAPVYRHGELRAHPLCRTDGLLGIEVAVVPVVIVLPALHKGEVEVAEAGADLVEVSADAAVTAVENLMSSAAQHKGAPLHRVLVERTASRKVPRGRTGDLDIVEGNALPPFEGGYLVAGNTPPAQVSIYAVRDDKAVGLRHERPDRPLVEVVVMVVGEQDGVDMRQVGYVHRRP